MRRVIVVSNRRLTRRTNLAVRLRFWILNSPIPEQRGESVNISKGGIFFKTELTLQRGAAIQLLMKMPRKISGRPPTEWRCTGHIVHVKPLTSQGSVGIGVGFDCFEILPITEPATV